MTNKIFRSTVFVAVVVLLCSLGVIMGALYDYHNARINLQSTPGVGTTITVTF